MRKALAILGTLILAGMAVCGAQVPREQGKTTMNLWDLANRKRAVHRFSTLLSAQDVRDHLSTEAGLQAAIAWCQQTGVTKVYIESFRDGYQADKETLLHAKQRFTAAGIEVSGCVTTTRVGKPSTGWKDVISCYTDRSTQDHLAAIFAFTAALFDEIMIDDFWFTDCTCPECEAARRARKVTIGDRTYPVVGETWEDYRRALMTHLSRDRILAPARAVNPRVKIILKYPQWYDQFQERGYDVVQETADFDRIWVGTEIRDYTDPRWGGTPQYEGYFIMRWLGGIGGAKCGGGWFDPYGTSERTYVEQARQTILGGARETLLFCYGSLIRDNGPRNVAALRVQQPDLFDVAEQVGKRKPIGIAAYKPPNSHQEDEARVFDFVGMLGLPLVPCHTFPADAPVAFFSVHALQDAGFAGKLAAFLKAGKVALITDGLARRLEGKLDRNAPNIHILPVQGDPRRLLSLAQAYLDTLRAPLLLPFKADFQAPGRVALYLYRDGSQVVENFNDTDATVMLNGETSTIPARSWQCIWK